MKKISYEEYLSSKQDTYIDVENPADCSTRYKNDKFDVMVFKAINTDDDPDYFFSGCDEDVCIIFRETDILIVYDCTWAEVLNEIRLHTERERIGARIAELRKAKGLTQEQLAEKAGFTQSNIWRIENGKYSVGIDILTAIADALEASVEIIKK